MRALEACKDFELELFCRGFPVDEYKNDRVGLVLAYWAIALHLGRPLVSQTDHEFEGFTDNGVYGSILNHITVGRHARRAPRLLVL